ncbi:unnamed protein product, partial [Amoebophrya sp. A120]
RRLVCVSILPARARKRRAGGAHGEGGFPPSLRSRFVRVRVENVIGLWRKECVRSA